MGKDFVLLLIQTSHFCPIVSSKSYTNKDYMICDHKHFNEKKKLERKLKPRTIYSSSESYMCILNSDPETLFQHTIQFFIITPPPLYRMENKIYYRI